MKAWSTSKTKSQHLHSLVQILRVNLPIWLKCVFLWTLVTFPLLFPMFSIEMLFHPSEIAQSSGRIMMNIGLPGIDIDSFTHLLAWPLPKLPWEIVTLSMKLKILISLKSFCCGFHIRINLWLTRSLETE